METTSPRSNDQPYVKITWEPSGRHKVELHRVQKMSMLRKLCVFGLRYGLKQVHSGRGLAPEEA